MPQMHMQESLCSEMTEIGLVLIFLTLVMIAVVWFLDKD